MAKETVKMDNFEEVELVKTKEAKEKKKEKKVVKDENRQTIKSEMKKVIWPSKKMMVKYSLVTIAMIAFFVLFFIGVSALFDLIYSLVQGWIG